MSKRRLQTDYDAPTRSGRRLRSLLAVVAAREREKVLLCELGAALLGPHGHHAKSHAPLRDALLPKVDAPEARGPLGDEQPPQLQPAHPAQALRRLRGRLEVVRGCDLVGDDFKTDVLEQFSNLIEIENFGNKL